PSHFSNFTQHHLHFHPTIQPYRHPKSLLFTHLPQHFSKQKYLLLNNHHHFSHYLPTLTPYQLFTYPITHEPQFIPKNIKQSFQAVQFQFSTPFGSFP
ncbi:Mur ligase family protein, partial [Staphylococcus epidermidis]|uniref:Mur ligase family protein n=1 Tax=Staphylococcus epidermidis TaxID=1282 RepID=UPI0037DA1CCA